MPAAVPTWMMPTGSDNYSSGILIMGRPLIDNNRNDAMVVLTP